MQINLREENHRGRRKEKNRIQDRNPKNEGRRKGKKQLLLNDQGQKNEKNLRLVQNQLANRNLRLWLQ